MFKHLSLSVLAALPLSLAIANVARAAEIADTTAAPVPATSVAPRNPISIAFLFGHGQQEAFKSGIGGRVGYTLASKLYLGGSFVWHFGTQDGPVQANVRYAGAEVGYELDAGPFIVRPYAGAGIASMSASVFVPAVGNYPGGRIEANDSRFAVWPGASVLVPFDAGRAFVGVDAKYLVVESAKAFNAYATLGVGF